MAVSDTAPGTIEVSLDACDFTWGEVHYVLGIELVGLARTGVASQHEIDQLSAGETIGSPVLVETSCGGSKVSDNQL